MFLINYVGSSFLFRNLFQTLLRNMKNLIELNISSCDSLTDQVFLLEEEKQAMREIYGFVSTGNCTYMPRIPASANVTNVNIPVSAFFTYIPLFTILIIYYYQYFFEVVSL